MSYIDTSDLDQTSPNQSEPIPQPAPPPPTLRRLFFGDDGLRAGWSILLFLILASATGLAVVLCIKHFHLLPKAPASHELTPRTALVGECLQLAVVLIPALLMALIERRPFARFGLASRRLLPDFFIGLFWGLLSLSALIGALFLTHAIAFDGLLLHGALASLFALKWAAVFFFVGLAEEFMFRGYLQYTVARGISGIVRTMNPRNRFSHVIGFWGAAFVFSVVLFMLAHVGNGGETAWGIFAVGLAGVVFAFSLYRTGSLWWGIGMHTSWDWAQSYLYGTPDSGNLAAGHLIASHPLGARLLSGGPDGPEGSILVIPTLLLVALVIHLTLPRRPYPLTPDQSPPQP